LINFNKRRLIAETIKELQTYQIQEYNFVEVQIIQVRFSLSILSFPRSSSFLFFFFSLLLFPLFSEMAI